jgi:hypothetical protein
MKCTRHVDKILAEGGDDLALMAAPDAVVMVPFIQTFQAGSATQICVSPILVCLECRREDIRPSGLVRALCLR